MKVKDILRERVIWMPSQDHDTAKPLVSVLLPTWKRAQSGLFSNAVQSVLQQSLSELELIIVDDCSTDGTFELIQHFMQEDPRVSCIRHTENIGLPAISEFEAYQKARGTYIAFMFDDNEWEPDAMKRMTEFVQRHQLKAAAGTYQLFIGHPGDSYDSKENWTTLGGSKVNLSDLMISNCFGNGAVLLHRDVIEKVGFLDPNIALSRLWDWDLWQRVAKEFRFEMADILVGREKGTGLEDSLGNTHQLFQWAAQERMHQPRNTELLPANYLECDIFEFSLPSSPFLYRSNCWIAKQYEKKPWFQVDDPSLLSVMKKSEAPWSGKRIAYLTASMRVNASATLNWGRLPYSKDYVVFYSSLQYFDYSNWILADAIIIERSLGPEIDVILKWAKHMGIACYYYTDDNFIALASDYVGTPLWNNMNSLAENMTLENMRKFDGMFCSTEALRSYFLEEKMCQTCTVLEPIYEPAYLQPYHAPAETLNILFMGSFIRGELLKKSVLPALIRLAQEHRINFYCPEETFRLLLTPENDRKGVVQEGKKREPMPGEWESVTICDGLVLINYPRTLSLELLLQRLGPENIQIQLHCGPLIKNNLYKTANALLNAVCLGAVLIATDDPPYSSLPKDPPVCLLAANHPDSWEAALRQAIDSEKHQTLYQNALTYCQKNYDGQTGMRHVLEALAPVEPYAFPDLNRRLLAHIQYLSSYLNDAPLPSTQNDASLVCIPRRDLSQTIQDMFPEWSNKKGLISLFPLAFSRPLACNQYIESRLSVTGGNIYVVVTPSSTTRVLFEFVANDSIIGQKFVYLKRPTCISLQVPQSDAPVSLRIANHTNNSLLYVLVRNLFFKSIIDITPEKGTA